MALCPTRKRVDELLHWLAPTRWVPRYTMVAFTRTPYSEALARSRRQDWWLSVAEGVAAAAVLGAVVAVGVRALQVSTRIEWERACMCRLRWYCGR